MEKYDLYKYEKELYEKGLNYIGGVDEVGRGPLIGPVVTACVVLPKDFVLVGLNDSKQLSEKKRNEYYKYIKEHAIACEVGIIGPEIIDEVNIYEATKLAMKQAIDKVNKKIKLVIAKVTRDEMMYELDKIYPQYGFKSHKGYPTKKHIEAINQYGLIEGYRKTYGPVKKIIEEGKNESI